MRGKEEQHSENDVIGSIIKRRKRYDHVKQGIMMLNFTIIFIALLMINLYFSLPFKTMIYVGEEYVYSLEMPWSDSEAQSEQPINLATGSPIANISFQQAIKVSTSQPGDYKLKVKALGAIPLKTMEISVLPKDSVVPLGTSIGVKIEMAGVMVVNISDVKVADGKSYSPAKDAGLKSGDVITRINDTSIKNSTDLTSFVEKNGGNQLVLNIKRDEQNQEISIKPSMEQDTNLYKLGIWVRDGTTGIGTMTFYDPKSGKFAALGHGIADADTGKIIDVGSGHITPATVVSVRKGERGNPGELKGYIKDDMDSLGEITLNNKFGVFGDLNSNFASSALPIPVASRDEINTGNAYILTSAKGQTAERYEIIIERVFKNSTDTNKGMIIKVVDQRLIDKTGGIVQGMSGSPIIQNNMIVGAVTHVFVNDPERGYGTFIDTMLEQMNKKV